MESSLPLERRQPNKEEEEESPKTHKIAREIIPTLEKNHGWGVGDHLYLYEGFWYSSGFLGGIISVQQNFTAAQPTDILLASAPKSGTTWLKALAFAIATRTRFDHSASPLLTTVPHECLPFLEIDLVDKIRDPEIPLLATHIPYTSLPNSVVSSDCKIVFIFRDPKDAFVSLWHFVCKLAPKDTEPFSLEEAFGLFSKGISPYGPYWDLVLGYWKASLDRPGRVLILKYEDMMVDTVHYVKELAEFMGYSFSSEEEKEGGVAKVIELCSFENLSNLDVNKSGKHSRIHEVVVENNFFFRKGKIGDWKNYLTVEMAEKIDKITEERFGSVGFLYSTKS